jgi:hypothetical protein
MSGLNEMLEAVRRWPARRWLVAAVAALGFVVLVGLPTAMISTPVFTRMIPPTWWAWPALIVTSALAGLLIASYVRAPQAATTRGAGAGSAGGFLTFLAVGCPVCNKLVLLALGSAGAVTWFAPVQPLLLLLAIGLLLWALARRLRFEYACPVPQPSMGSTNA